MEINIIYSKDNAEHLRTLTFIKQAVHNLGISARINECESGMRTPKVVVNGFDLFEENTTQGKNISSGMSYDMIEQALEQTAW
jgi:hypothetical protein